MYRAFNLTGCDWKHISRAPGDAIFDEARTTVKKSLVTFLNGEIIDGTRLTSHWFPTISADVFISHSHKDEEDAIKCAGWLKNEFNLKPFIDSSVWGYADNLLKLIDDEFCLNPGGDTYDYKKRNRSTSHVHMMLSTALSAMLDATECVVFINTPNSITSSESIDKTQSPWLSFELGTMRVIRRKKPVRKVAGIRKLMNETIELDIIKAAEFKAEYEVPLSELTPLTGSQLADWHNKAQSNSATSKNILDLLYEEIAPEKT